MKMSKNSRVASAIAFSMLLFALPAMLSAQDVAAWFSKTANKTAYGSIAGEVDALAAALRGAALSDSLLSQRLEEGARKRVPAAIMLSTLREDVERYMLVSGTLNTRKLLPSDIKKATTTVAQVSLLLRAGTTETELEASLDAGVALMGVKAPAVARAIAALTVTAAARAELGLREEDSPSFAAALVRSGLADKNLGFVLASAKKLVAKGESANVALDETLASLSKDDSSGSKPGTPKDGGSPAPKENKGQNRPEKSGESGKKPDGNGIDGGNGSGRGIEGSRN